MAEIRGYHQKVDSTYYFFGEVTEILIGSGDYADKVTNVKFKSSYYSKEAGGEVDIINTIAFWDEPEKLVNNTLIREKKLSTRIRNSKVGDKLLLKCYVYDDGRIKAQNIGYENSCFPVKKGDKVSNIIYGKIYSPKMGSDGRFRFSIGYKTPVDGEFVMRFVQLTISCSEQFNNLAGRAEKLIKDRKPVLCDISDIKSSDYIAKDGSKRTGYSAWLSRFVLA